MGKRRPFSKDLLAAVDISVKQVEEGWVLEKGRGGHTHCQHRDERSI